MKCKECNVQLTVGINITLSQIKNSDKKCKSCRKLYIKNHYIQNKEKYLEHSKDWKESNKEKDKELRVIHYQENKEYYKSKSYEWKENNPERHKEYMNGWRKEWINNPSNKLKSILYKFVNTGLKGKNKNQSSLNILGLNNWEEFKQHIESQFSDGMTWENYGKGKNNETWHVDHIIPLSSALTEDEVYKLNHYTNLKPMWCSDNIRKSNKLL
jgi:hypothetical protein